jgi:hypothetical protein
MRGSQLPFASEYRLAQLNSLRSAIGFDPCSIRMSTDGFEVLHSAADQISFDDCAFVLGRQVL